MKFIAIAALVATASAADIASGKKCTKDDKCTTTTECCGTVANHAKAADRTSGYEDLKASTSVTVCYDKTKTKWQGDYTSTKAVDGDLFVAKDFNKKAEGTFKCLATTGASQITAAAAVLAASFYMA